MKSNPLRTSDDDDCGSGGNGGDDGWRAVAGTGDNDGLNAIVTDGQDTTYAHGGWDASCDNVVDDDLMGLWFGER